MVSSNGATIVKKDSNGLIHMTQQNDCPRTGLETMKSTTQSFQETPLEVRI